MRTVFFPFQFLGISLAFLFTSCAPDKQSVSIPKTDLAIKTMSTFSDEEAFQIEELRKKGGIRIGMVQSPSGFVMQHDGTYRGLNYDIAKAFADFLSVPLKIESLKISDYFSKDGRIPNDVKTNPDIQYTPDVFTRVDVLGGNITILPWREKLMTMFQIFPARLMAVGRKGMTAAKPEDLAPLKIASVPFTTYEKTLNALAADLGKPLNILNLEKETDFFDKTVNKEVDAFLTNSIEIFLVQKNWPQLAVLFPIGEESKVGWGISKDNIILKGLLSKFAKTLTQDKVLDRIFLRNMGISFEDYIRLIQGN